ncbi:MAG: hypothetical protein WC421_10780 [Elusimicrobiales bacterium]
MRPVLAAALCACAAFMCACAGPSRAYKTKLQGQIAAGNYDGAIAEINAAKTKEYSKKNSVLYHLDLGMVEHDAGKCEQSDADFDAAEARMDELYTKSISRAAGTLLINDNTTEYAGEPHERALLNVFRSLNFICLGRLDDAAVEARKVAFYLDHLRQARGGKYNYRDDGFAQYLASLVFSETGKADDARICMANAMNAYAAYPAGFAMPAPQQAAPPGGGNGEIVFFHYNGMAPAKVSRTFQVAWNDAVIAMRASGDAEAGGARVKNALDAGILGNAITVSYPEYEDMPFIIKSSEVSADSAAVSAKTEVVENIAAIARDELANAAAAQRTRMVARAAIKYILAKAAEQKAEQQSQGLGLLAKVVAGAVTAATEVADTRSWATLPAEIRMARLELPPGRYDLKLTFRDAYGNAAASDVMRGVEVSRGKRTFAHYRTAR